MEEETTNIPFPRAAQRVANVARALLALAERWPHDGRLAELRKVAQHLVELAEAHARGELPALADDGSPF